MRQIRQLPTLPSLLAKPGTPFIHRDISWLHFNERVLDEARPSSGNPVLERVKFLAISAANLDEYFMIRVASLNRKIRNQSRLAKWAATFDHSLSVWDSILETVAKFGAKQVEVLEMLVPELRSQNIHLVVSAKETATTFEIGKALFETEVLPRLSPPENFDLSKLHSLPNLRTAAIFPNRLWFAVPSSLPLLLSKTWEGVRYYFFLDDLLEVFLGATFGLDGEVGLVRLTRDADISVEIADEDPEVLPDVVLARLLSREKGLPIRLQYRGDWSDDLLTQMGETLKLKPAQIVPAAGSLSLHALWTLVKDNSVESASENGLIYPPLPAPLPAFFRERSTILEKLRHQDYLLHHPYDPFDAFIEFVRAAAQDPKVKSIEQTIYRMDAASPLVGVLKEAAASGKKVRVIIELRARFDEYNNLRLADELRKSGIEVSYGLSALKLHAKVTLITREEPEGPRYYTHLSTGNYNATTARQYTDLAILTFNQEIGKDARAFIDAAWDGKLPSAFKHLLSAPTGLHRKLVALIEGETKAALAGGKTRIVAKVNALVDEQVVEALYKASQAGVKIDLIVRGACSLIPGVRGLSENIQVVSVVDRFLEHSRLYYFQNARALYLSSADCMPRNFFSRLELAFPVLDPKIYDFIEQVVIPTYLADNVKARELTPQGTWKRRARRASVERARSQFVFERLASQAYQGTSLER
jgi:polyphosphate kinase